MTNGHSILDSVVCVFVFMSTGACVCVCVCTRPWRPVIRLGGPNAVPNAFVTSSYPVSGLPPQTSVCFYKQCVHTQGPTVCTYTHHTAAHG